MASQEESPFSSMRCDEFTILSKIASAMVLSPIILCQSETGICEAIMVEVLSCLSSIISIIVSQIHHFVELSARLQIEQRK